MTAGLRKLGRWVAALVMCGAMGLAHSKLPAPPPLDPAKAAEAKEKAAAAAKKDAEALAKAQDRAVEHYKKAKGGPVVATAKPATAAKK